MPGLQQKRRKLTASKRLRKNSIIGDRTHSVCTIPVESITARRLAFAGRRAYCFDKGNTMKQIISFAVLSIFLAGALTPSALADSRAHHAAIKVCKQNYKNAVRGAKYL